MTSSTMDYYLLILLGLFLRLLAVMYYTLGRIMQKSDNIKDNFSEIELNEN